MKKSPIKRVFVVWAILVSLVAASLLFPHAEAGPVTYVNTCVQMLLLVISVFLAKREPTFNNRLIFVNFSVLFGLSLLFHVYNFMPIGFSKWFLFQYGTIAYYFVLCFSLGYVTIDLLFREWGSLAKYLTAFAIVGGFFIMYFYPFMGDPMYLYSTEDARDYALLQEAFDTYVEETGSGPTSEYLASNVTLPSLGPGFTGQASLERVEALYPYLSGNNYIVLTIRPLYVKSILMGVVSLGFVLLFFAYQYLKDPPQGAYIEKIMFLFLIFCTLEILHSWSYVKSIEWSAFYEIMNIGQIISVGILLLIGIFFLLRLRFITSPNGEFYEQEIATSPAGVTRWRDMFDELILAHFINKNHVLGRFFVDRKRTG